VKFATTAQDITDVARVFQITVHSQVSGVSSIVKLYKHNLCSNMHGDTSWFFLSCIWCVIIVAAWLESRSWLLFAFCINY